MKAGSLDEPAFTVSLPLPPESTTDAIALLEPLALGESFGGIKARTNICEDIKKSLNDKEKETN